MSSSNKRKVKIIIDDDDTFNNIKTDIQITTIKKSGKKYTYKFHGNRILFYCNGSVMARKKIPEDVIKKLDENIHCYRTKHMSAEYKQIKEEAIKFIAQIEAIRLEIKELLIKYPNSENEVFMLIQFLDSLNDRAKYCKENPENGGINKNMRTQISYVRDRITAIKFMEENYTNQNNWYSQSNPEFAKDDFRDDIPLTVNYLERSYNKWYYENVKYIEESKGVPVPEGMSEEWRSTYNTHLSNGENIKQQLEKDFFGSNSLVGPFTLLTNHNINNRRDWKLWMLKNHSDKNAEADGDLSKLINAAVSLVYPDRPID